MTNLKLYALALTAKRYEDQISRRQVRPAVCLAQDEDQAVGRGIATARELWPVEESWFNHAAGATEVPAWMVETVYSKEVTND